MKCPSCTENTPDAWDPLWVLRDQSRMNSLKRGHYGFHHVALDWMHCANPECQELVIRVHETTQIPGNEAMTNSWLACPRFSRRSLDTLVPDPFKSDYMEAAAILDRSPRMSAVLSRRMLADILDKYAKLTDFSLRKRMDAFVADNSYPHGLRQNVGYLAEMGNFGAHTQVNDQAEVVDVDQDEAEWTLDVVNRLLDHFVVSPEKDRLMRERFDEKLKDAKRDPIEPAPENGTT